jgi:hypothetical protein
LLHAVIYDGVRPAFPEGTPEWYSALAARCWAAAANRRPSFNKIAAHLAAIPDEQLAWGAAAAAGGAAPAAAVAGSGGGTGVGAVMGAGLGGFPLAHGGSGLSHSLSCSGTPSGAGGAGGGAAGGGGAGGSNARRRL